MSGGSWLVSLAVMIGAATLALGCREKASPGPGLTPNEAPGVTIRCRLPAVGDRWRVVKTSTAETKNHTNGGSIDARFEADEERLERVLAVATGTVTRVEVRYTRHARRITVRGQPDRVTAAPVIDKTFVVERMPEGGVVILEDGVPAGAAEEQIVRQDYVAFGQASPNPSALCDVDFRPGQAAGDPDGAAEAQRKRAGTQPGEGASVDQTIMRFVRRDRGAALFSIAMETKTESSSTHSRHDMWIRPHDGIVTRTETDSRTEITSRGPGIPETKLTTTLFHVEQREGP